MKNIILLFSLTQKWMRNGSLQEWTLQQCNEIHVNDTITSNIFNVIFFKSSNLCGGDFSIENNDIFSDISFDGTLLNKK